MDPNKPAGSSPDRQPSISISSVPSVQLRGSCTPSTRQMPSSAPVSPHTIPAGTFPMSRCEQPHLQINTSPILFHRPNFLLGSGDHMNTPLPRTNSIAATLPAQDPSCAYLDKPLGNDSSTLRTKRWLFETPLPDTLSSSKQNVLPALAFDEHMGALVIKHKSMAPEKNTSAAENSSETHIVAHELAAATCQRYHHQRRGAISIAASKLPEDGSWDVQYSD